MEGLGESCDRASSRDDTTSDAIIPTHFQESK